MDNPIKVDDLGGKPTIFGNTQMDGWKPSASPFGDGFGTEEGAQGADRTDESRRRLRWQSDRNFVSSGGTVMGCFGSEKK